MKKIIFQILKYIIVFIFGFILSRFVITTVVGRNSHFEWKNTIKEENFVDKSFEDCYRCFQDKNKSQTFVARRSSKDQ